MKRLLNKRLHSLPSFNVTECLHIMKNQSYKTLMLAAVFFCLSAFFCPADSYALFEDLAKHGGKIFVGMREIIYAVSGFGIIAIVIGSIFGSINYKWLSAIIIGLFVIAGTAALINYMVDDQVITPEMISDTIKTGS